MPGRPDFSQAGTQGSGQKVAVSNRPEISIVKERKDGDVASGGTEAYEIYAPTGSVYTVLGAYLYASPISSATTGSHEIVVQGPAAGILKGETNYDGYVGWHYSEWENAPKSAQPSSSAAQAKAMTQVKATENQPITVKYVNDSDATQTDYRRFNFSLEEVSY